jgi:hypothetical protein
MSRDGNIFSATCHTGALVDVLRAKAAIHQKQVKEQSE